jgi:uridine kinase
VDPRAEVISALADGVLVHRHYPVTRLAVDGVDGAGKTVLADELADELRARGTPVVRASADDFLNPAAVRHRRGRDSPEGFFRDSLDHAALRRVLLDPLAPAGSLQVRLAVHDLVIDQPVDAPVETVEPGSILVVDGLFLHSDELASCWDVSVFVEVRFAVSVARMAQRDGSSPDPAAGSNRRYVEGQKLYLAECDPASRATFVVENDDLAAPVLRIGTGS